MPREITRRQFLKTTVSGVGVGLTMAALSPSALGGPQYLERRPLGRTGLEVTILGLGCVALGDRRHSIEGGARIVDACLDAGINYIDCAGSYGDAEMKVGEVMKRRRGQVILTAKVLERNRNAAWAEINRSLERLQTSSVDLLQVHAINRLEDLDRIMAADGSMGAVLRAQGEGMASHIGITGHARPEVLVEALRRFPFETTLIPLSSTDKLLHDFGEVLFPLAVQHQFGVIAMKVLAAGKVTQWVAQSLRYAFSLPVATAIVGMGTENEVRQNVEVARTFTPMTPQERIVFEEQTKTFATTDVLWWKRR